MKSSNNLSIQHIYLDPQHARKNSYGLVESETRFNELYDELRRLETQTVAPAKRFVFHAKTSQSPIRQRNYLDVLSRILSELVKRSKYLTLSYSIRVYSIIKLMFGLLNDYLAESQSHRRSNSNSYGKRRSNAGMIENYDKLLILMFQWQCILYARKYVLLT